MIILSHLLHDPGIWLLTVLVLGVAGVVWWIVRGGLRVRDVQVGEFWRYDREDP